MKGFKLTDSGDVQLAQGDITLTHGTALLCQSIRQLITTQQGEWWLDEKEGINYRAVLCKNPNIDHLQNQIQRAILTLHDGLHITRFDHAIDGRALTVDFDAATADGTVSLSTDARYR